MRHIIRVGVACLVLVCCGNGEEPSGEVTTTSNIEASSTTGSITTTTVSAAQLARAEGVGNVAAGEELFGTPMEGIPHDFSCSTCHTLDGTSNGRNPSLLGISKAAGERVEGMSDVDYLRQSLTDPLAFKPEGWTATMPYQYEDVLDDEQVNNLVAFLLTR